MRELLVEIADIFVDERVVTSAEQDKMRNAGISARLLRGLAGSADFERLTEQAYWERRPYVMMLDADGIAELIATAIAALGARSDRRAGDFGLELVRAAGWPDDFTRELKAKPGMCFKVALVIGGEHLVPATWSRVLASMRQHITSVGADNDAALAALDQALPELQAASARGETLGDLLGADAHKIDLGTFLASRQTTADVLRYAMECTGANELFTGDGHTRTVSGERGPRELLAPNQPLAVFSEHLLVDLPIATPS
jgi:hypothetical protein